MTSTNLSTSPNPSDFGGRVVLTATVTSADGSTVGGSVTFMEGSTVLGVVGVGPGGKVTFDDSSLPVGSNPITAVYSGDPGHAQNVSNPVTQVVEPTPTVTPKIASPSPAVVSLQRFGYHMQPTSLVLTFSSALDPASATDVSNYRITTLGGHGRGGSLVGHTTAIKKAIYDPSTFTVTLVPVGRLDIHNRYRLTVNGTSRTGVRNPSGLLLDAKATGEPGSNYVAEITWRTLDGPAPGFSGVPKKADSTPAKRVGGPSATGFDAIAASGELGKLGRENRSHGPSGN